MKTYLVFLFLLVPTVAAAQNFQDMNMEDMQNMMGKMQKMQSCMENIDQEQLKEIEQRSLKLEEEVDSLCADGKRDEAQKRAISFGKEMAKSPALKAIRECGEMAQGMIPKMPSIIEGTGDANQHVCD